ncbi:MAG: thiamine phosphate synthase [Treponema sp.]|jgi:thiamine-phosphate pyrophosphorylase|nr:thiamine phosphate synthase [Treponema sp.]
MFKILGVTNRGFFSGRASFLKQLEAIAAAGIDGVILREKDLDAGEYLDLAGAAREICLRYGVPLIIHGFIAAARSLGVSAVQLPWDRFRALVSGPGAADLPAGGGETAGLSLGVSVHSPEDARFASERGASWLVAGNVFESPCKPGLPGRGPEFLAAVCGAVSGVSPVPVCGIGGVTVHTIAGLARTGAAGACLMSSLMESPDPAALLKRLRDSLRGEAAGG